MEAYSHQSACVLSVVRMINNLKTDNWVLPVMFTVCLDLRIVAQKADKQGIKNILLLLLYSSSLDGCFSYI